MLLTPLNKNTSIFVTFSLLLSANCLAGKVEVEPSDCGPLERGELGVIFSVGKFGSDQVYFIKGKANEICPKLMSAKSISGYESDYCEKYEPLNLNECSVIKIFTITGYQYDSNTK